MENRARQMIEGALLLDFAETDSFDPAGYDYKFSGKFEAAMERIFTMADRAYVSVGRRRIRRAAALALAAVLIMATAVCGVAVTKPLVKWLTSQNEEQGTMDVTFEVEDPNGLTKEFRHIKPETPEGYRIVMESKSDQGYDIEYEGEDGSVIYYSQSGAIESMDLSIDSEDSNLQEVEINGYHGYSSFKYGTYALTWSDGIYLFDLAGTCDSGVLDKMAETIK